MLNTSATQTSEYPVFWCALIVPGDIQTWLVWMCLFKFGFFYRTEILAYVKVPPARVLFGCSKIWAPARMACWESPSCLVAFLSGEGIVISHMWDKRKLLTLGNQPNETKSFKRKDTLFSLKRARLYPGCSAIKCQLPFSDLSSSTNPLEWWN